ncbi:MAG: acyl-CoA thioesterase domain-containing protein [Planctomycetota bacterium]
MPATTEPDTALLSATRDTAHPACIVCSHAHECGLGLRFRVLPDGSVDADMPCNAAFEGYVDVVHGGVVCCVLDGAMTNCLFARGLTGVTAKMELRFRHSVMVNRPAAVRAWPVRTTGSVHVLRARLVQDGEVKAEATGTFMEKEPKELTAQRQ